ncbi:MAG: hypothetical protein DMG58_17420 [Acidobacteria bacterium]|nr:MAG: hypothetical protein DMG58_17420 [Acidobacteriota bacterium]
MKSARLAVILLFLYAACARKPGVDVQADLEQKFQQMMSGVTLIGHSANLKDESTSGEEKYVIEKVSKLRGDTWLFHVRIQYGSHDIPVPLPVTIKWAGDTPVITLTNLTIPGLGTYTARVLLYQDQYAGTWSSTDHGGQVFGKIVRQR